MDRWLRLYHGLPPSLRSLAANVRGAQLARWRYGAETEKLVEEALERETWKGDRWRAWQEERLGRLLARAAKDVPYYRRQWEERRRRGDSASSERLGSWPLLPKEAVRSQPEAFLADDCRPSKMFLQSSSGTTGTPLRLWWSLETTRHTYALHEARVRRWNGIGPDDRLAIVGGQLVAPVARTKPPFWVWIAALHQLYMSAYHLSPRFVPSYVEALHRYRVVALIGYPSALHAMARMILDERIDAPRLRVAIGNAEPFPASQREVVEQAFGCPTRETYGMTEIVAAASEDDDGLLRLWPEVGILEVWQDDVPKPAAEGELGRFVATGLLNVDMPLVRYEVGDHGVIGPVDFVVRGGRTLPLLRTVEGRSDDLVITPDGRRVGRLDPVFKGELDIREAQIVQEELGRVRVLVVPGSRFDDRQRDDVRQRLGERLGPDVEIVVDRVDYIERGKGGKFRAVVSRLDSTRARGPDSSVSAPPEKGSPERREA